MTTQWQQWWFHSSGVSLAVTSCLTRCSYSTMTMKWRTTRGAASSSSSFGYQDIESLRESNTTIARRSLLPQNCVGLAASLSSFWIFFTTPTALSAMIFNDVCPGARRRRSRGASSSSLSDAKVIISWLNRLLQIAEGRGRQAAAWCGPLWSLKIWAKFPLKSPAAEPQRALIEDKWEALRSPPAHARPLWGGRRWWSFRHTTPISTIILFELIWCEDKSELWVQ